MLQNVGERSDPIERRTVAERICVRDQEGAWSSFGADA